MKQKHKICILGAFSVGKTSLVSQYVLSIFPDKYLTTVGVKIDKKTVTVDDCETTLLIWDLYGEDALQQIRSSYVKGASGYLLVADGTRPETLDTARKIQNRMTNELGPLPFVLMLNKCDLVDQWALDSEILSPFEQEEWIIQRCSARTGEGVEAGFRRLTVNLIEARP
jgi:small GTP-binding protein